MPSVRTCRRGVFLTASFYRQLLASPQPTFGCMPRDLRRAIVVRATSLRYISSRGRHSITSIAPLGVVRIALVMLRQATLCTWLSLILAVVCLLLGNQATAPQGIIGLMTAVYIHMTTSFPKFFQRSCGTAHRKCKPSLVFCLCEDSMLVWRRRLPPGISLLMRNLVQCPGEAGCLQFSQFPFPCEENHLCLPGIDRQRVLYTSFFDYPQGPLHSFIEDSFEFEGLFLLVLLGIVGKVVSQWSQLLNIF